MIPSLCFNFAFLVFGKACFASGLQQSFRGLTEGHAYFETKIGVKLVEHKIVTEHARTKQRCAIACLRYVNCLSFNFDSVNHVCELSDSNGNISPGEITSTPGGGWSYSHIYGDVDDDTTTTETPVITTESTTEATTIKTDCTSYERHPNHAMASPGRQFDFYGIATEDSCFQLCLDETGFRCIASNYEFGNNYCQIVGYDVIAQNNYDSHSQRICGSGPGCFVVQNDRGSPSASNQYRALGGSYFNTYQQAAEYCQGLCVSEEWCLVSDVRSNACYLFMSSPQSNSIKHVRVRKCW
ncbi:unnamed protein product [Owenia fusiformis]|uniref:Apple domain-containing protein n=1 Tax=Owenia fusiformis TaxID=6347 RepID=A0A8S4N309_OWEFU|nr:unnamed protein product [Owenia fusiformis]